MKKIGLYLLVLLIGITCFYKPTVTYAQEDNIMIIALPSNEISMIDLYGTSTYAEYMLMDVLFDLYKDPNDETILVNSAGKRIIDSHITSESVYFEYHEGATEEDCLIDLPDFIIAATQNMGLNYTKVQFVLKEFDHYAPKGDSLVIDLKSYDNLLYTKCIDLFLLNYVANPDYGFLSQAGSNLYRDLNYKTLVKMKDGDKDVLELVDASGEDDIIAELTDEDIARLEEDEIHASGYEKIVMKFGNTEYDESYFVLDCSTNEKLNDNFSKFKKTWKLFAEKNMVKDVVEVLIFYDLNKNVLFILPEYPDGSYLLDSSNNYVYADNLTFDISNNNALKDALNNSYGITGKNKIIIKFADPEFIEGEGQVCDSSEDDTLSFRLNIPFDKFQESGVVYMDGEVVDPKYYTASEGSTIITFKKDYTSGLDSGDHTVQVRVSDGTATADFNIVGNSPATGDHVIIYISLLITGIAGLLITRKLRKNN